MSEEIETPEEREEEESNVVFNENGVIIRLKTFSEGSSKEGFSYHEKNWEDLDSVVADIGLEKALDLIHTAANSAQSQKAASQLPSFEDDPDGAKRAEAWNNLRENGKTVLLTEQDARSWAPNQREVSAATATARLNKAIKELKDAAAEGADEGKLDMLRASVKRALLVKEEADARQSAEMDALLNLG